MPPPLSVTIDDTELHTNPGAEGPDFANVAVTFVSAVSVSVHVELVPEHAPPQPANVEPVPAVAVSVTVSPLVRICEHHSAPSLHPRSGGTKTLPVPSPALSIRKTG